MTRAYPAALTEYNSPSNLPQSLVNLHSSICSMSPLLQTSPGSSMRRQSKHCSSHIWNNFYSKNYIIGTLILCASSSACYWLNLLIHFPQCSRLHFAWYLESYLCLCSMTSPSPIMIKIRYRNYCLRIEIINGCVRVELKVRRFSRVPHACIRICRCARHNDWLIPDTFPGRVASITRFNRWLYVVYSNIG